LTWLGLANVEVGQSPPAGAGNNRYWAAIWRGTTGVWPSLGPARCESPFIGRVDSPIRTQNSALNHGESTGV